MITVRMWKLFTVIFCGISYPASSYEGLNVEINRYNNGRIMVRTERGKCMTQCICKKLGFDSLAYQSLKGVVESVGIGKENLCTYCWDGKE